MQPKPVKPLNRILALLPFHASRFPKDHNSWKVPRLHPFVLPVRSTCRRRLVRSADGMTRTGETVELGKKSVALPQRHKFERYLKIHFVPRSKHP